MQNLFLLSFSRWVTRSAPLPTWWETLLGKSNWSAEVGFSWIISSVEGISVLQILFEHSSHISGIIRHSSHLLLCSESWVCHESSLGLLLFSPPCYHSKLSEEGKKRHGAGRVCWPSSTYSVCLPLCSLNREYTCPFEEAGRCCILITCEILQLLST